MFNISNTRKFGDLNFHTAKGRPVILRANTSRDFEVEDLNEGLLRVMIGKGSFYKVRADSEEAENLVKLATERKKKKGSAIVHGSTEPRSPDFISVRDMKNQKRKSTEPDEGEDGKRVFIKEEETPSTPQPELPAPPPEPTPLEKLIEGASEIPFTEFRIQAKDLLGDDFPTGNPGRPALVEALKAKLAQPALVPQE